ncbi:MAG: hypothetical protein K2N73_00365 [Lachnospiraceae bacterium]|nr:hypothetical protein [Lachnospiraceae bacterium]
MKKESTKAFQTGKRAGIMLCAFLTVSLWVLTGCSDTKNDAGAADVFSENTDDGAGSDVLETSTAGEQAAENMMILTIIKSGEPEEKQAELVTGEGFSIYLPTDEWRQMDGANHWCTVINQDVQIWVESYENDNLKEEALSGWQSEEGILVKQQDGLLYKAHVHEAENGVWCVFYCCPLEAEEGWGRELSVIVDTFSIEKVAEM